MSMPEPTQQSEFAIDASLILPRIKHVEFNVGLSLAGTPADQLPVTEPLVGKLLVTYAFDLPQGFMMVRPQDLAQLGLAREQLRKLSLDNLKKQMPQIAVEPAGADGELRRVVTGNHFDACTLLATKFWNTVATQVAGEVVMAVPSRDVVLFCSSQSAPALQAMAQTVAEVLRNETGHALSEEFFAWRSGEWQVAGRVT
jgi:uncharacterized protein YtpQ (UPF0354 family)